MIWTSARVPRMRALCMRAGCCASKCSSSGAHPQSPLQHSTLFSKCGCRGTAHPPARTSNKEAERPAMKFERVGCAAQCLLQDRRLSCLYSELARLEMVCEELGEDARAAAADVHPSYRNLRSRCKACSTCQHTRVPPCIPLLLHSHLAAQHPHLHHCCTPILLRIHFPLISPFAPLLLQAPLHEPANPMTVLRVRQQHVCSHPDDSRTDSCESAPAPFGSAHVPVASPEALLNA